jgi:hypothetical protein
MILQGPRHEMEDEAPLRLHSIESMELREAESRHQCGLSAQEEARLLALESVI